MRDTSSQSGFIALVSILLVAALVFIIAIGLSSRSLGIGDVSFAEESSYRALMLAESCAERTLSELREDALYAGEQSIPVGEESCHIGAVTTLGPEHYSFTADAEIARYIKKISVEATVNASSTEIVLWDEIPME